MSSAKLDTKTPQSSLAYLALMGKQKVLAHVFTLARVPGSVSCTNSIAPLHPPGGG